jgi:hypothetical protein
VLTPDALLGVEGSQALAAAEELLAAGEPELRVAEQLRRGHPADLAALAVEQAGLRRGAAAKFPQARWMLFTRAGLEQATAHELGAHRARRVASIVDPDSGRWVVDLCCGIGGDLSALSGAEIVAAGFDLDPVHARLAAHNSGLPTVVADVTGQQWMFGVQAIFADPARRTGDRRHPATTNPPLDWFLGLEEEQPFVTVKAAPGLALGSVPERWEVEFVADGRQLREAVLWSPAYAAGVRTRATVFPGPTALVPRPGATAEVRPPGGFVLDPNPAVTRAGGVADLAEQLGAWQVDPRIAFLSADRRLDSPFGRGLRVEASLPFREPELRALLKARDVGPLDVRRRGLAGDVDALRQRLRPSGARRATLLMTRVADAPWALLCTDPDEPPLPGG